MFLFLNYIYNKQTYKTKTIFPKKNNYNKYTYIITKTTFYTKNSYTPNKTK